MKTMSFKTIHFLALAMILSCSACATSPTISKTSRSIAGASPIDECIPKDFSSRTTLRVIPPARFQALEGLRVSAKSSVSDFTLVYNFSSTSPEAIAESSLSSDFPPSGQFDVELEVIDKQNRQLNQRMSAICEGGELRLDLAHIVDIIEVKVDEGVFADPTALGAIQGKSVDAQYSFTLSKRSPKFHLVIFPNDNTPDEIVFNANLISGQGTVGHESFSVNSKNGNSFLLTIENAQIRITPAN